MPLARLYSPAVSEPRSTDEPFSKSAAWLYSEGPFGLKRGAAEGGIAHDDTGFVNAEGAGDAEGSAFSQHVACLFRIVVKEGFLIGFVAKRRAGHLLLIVERGGVAQFFAGKGAEILDG